MNCNRSTTMGFTYFFQQADECCFKIGSSESNVEGRLSSCQVGNPKPLRIFGKIETPEYEKLENDLHEEFASFKENGEWYSIDPVTAVRTITELNGKICVDDPYRFSVNNGKTSIDIENLTEVVEKRIMYSVNSALQKKFSSFIDDMKITSEMVKAIVHRKACRHNALVASIPVFFSLFFIASAVIFFFCFGGFFTDWKFSTDKIITFSVIDSIAFILSFAFGLTAWDSNYSATDNDINWYLFNRLKKKFLKEK